MVGIIGSFVSVGVDIVDVTTGLVGIWEVSANNQNLSGDMNNANQQNSSTARDMLQAIKNSNLSICQNLNPRLHWFVPNQKKPSLQIASH